MKWFFLHYAYEEGINPDSGGFRKLWEVAWALQDRGHEVYVFYPALPGWHPLRPVPSCSYPVVNRRGMRAITAYVSQFWAVLRKGWTAPPDFIYFRTGVNVLPVMIGRMLRARVVSEVVDDAVELLRVEGAYVKSWLVLQVEKAILRHSFCVVTMTQGLKRKRIERHRLQTDVIRVIPSATDAEHFVPAAASEAKTRLGLPSNAIIVGFVGIFYRHQGIDILIQAAPHILSALPSARFLLVGEGVARSSWEALARDLGVGSACWFTGQIPFFDAPGYLQAMDIFVAPFTKYRGETSPFKIFDALSCARPVVASDLPAVRRLATGFGGAITLVPAEDPIALAKAVISLAEEPERCVRLGKRGRLGILRHYTWKKVAEDLEGALLDQLKKGTLGMPRFRGSKDMDFRVLGRAAASYISILSKKKRPQRQQGLSALMRVKDEETWISASIQSIATVADEIIVADNGSTDGTPDILQMLQRELPNRLIVLKGTDLDIKQLTNLLIEHSRFRWILRWDADFVARTEGDLRIQGFRRWLEDLDPRRFYFVYPRMVEVCGDLVHQRPESPTRADCHCFTYSDHLRYVYDAHGYESPSVPWWYQACRFDHPTFFHLDVKPAERMFRSFLWKQYLVDKRRLRDEDFETYVRRRVQSDWGIETVRSASRRWTTTAFRDLMPYDQKEMGPYPSLLQPYLAQPQFQIVYEDGQIIDRLECTYS